MTAMVIQQIIILLQRRRHARCGRLLSDGEVHGAVHFAAGKKLFGHFFECTDFAHQA